MAKADSKTETTDAATAAPAASPVAAPGPELAQGAALVLGQQVRVQPAPGAKLVNNETGQFFADAEPTLVHVTVTLLRRLADGDLVLLA